MHSPELLRQLRLEQPRSTKPTDWLRLLMAWLARRAAPVQQLELSVAASPFQAAGALLPLPQEQGEAIDLLSAALGVFGAHGNLTSLALTARLGCHVGAWLEPLPASLTRLSLTCSQPDSFSSRLQHLTALRELSLVCGSAFQPVLVPVPWTEAARLPGCLTRLRMPGTGADALPALARPCFGRRCAWLG